MKDKLLTLLRSVRLYWRAPPKGRYMPFREILSLSVGGIGVKLITYCVSQMVISIGNVLIGNTIGISPSAIYVIYIVSVLSGFPLTALRARMIDNTRSMKGKYRPYIITMGIPSAVIGALFILTPYESMSAFGKACAVLVYNIGFQFFYNFYIDAFDSLINVLSPNSIERSDVLSIKSVIENFSPSVVNILWPIIARAVTGQDTLYDMKVYRVLFPPMLVLGFLISVLAYVNTKEKIVQARTHALRVRFIDAFRAIASNKYFWIISLAGWIGFLEGSFGNILGWMYNYQHACTPAQYSIVVAIAGNASFWPNLVAPYFIRRYGKRAILISTNLANVFFILLMLPIIRRVGRPETIWLLLGCIFINQFITSLGHLLGPSIQADIRDYQQYVTGERIDGMFAAVGLIGNVVTLLTGSVLPAIYERSGLNAATAVRLGYSGANVYDVLYDPGYFTRIAGVLIVASVVGAALNAVPFFFYDLSETDQKGMVAVLKIRALFEDYGNGVLTDEALTEAVELIREARDYCGRTQTPTRRLRGKARREAAAENEKIGVAKRVMDELGRFDTEHGAEEAAQAARIVEAGPDGFLDIELPDRRAIRAMPRSTRQERERRRDAILLLRSFRVAESAVRRHFPNGVEPFDADVFDALFTREDENEAAISACLADLKQARETKDKAETAACRERLRALRLEKAQIARQIKEATDANALYARAAKPYLDAKRLLVRAENYRNIGHIETLYEQLRGAEG